MLVVLCSFTTKAENLSISSDTHRHSNTNNENSNSHINDVRLGWRVIRDIVSETPKDVYVDIVGEQLPFIRNPPKAIDDSIVGDFYESFNFMQEVGLEPSKYYPCGEDGANVDDSCPLYVATIPNATITGEPLS